MSWKEVTEFFFEIVIEEYFWCKEEYNWVTENRSEDKEVYSENTEDFSEAVRFVNSEKLGFRKVDTEVLKEDPCPASKAILCLKLDFFG